MRMLRDRGNRTGRTINQQRDDTWRGSKNDRNQSPLKFTCTLCKKVILAIDVDHAILQYALPLIFDSGNLDSRSEQMLHLPNKPAYFVVGAKHDIAHTWTLIWVLLTFRVRVI